MYPVLAQVGGTPVYSFAATALVALLAGGATAVAGLRRAGLRSRDAVAIAVLVAASGVAGARAWWLVAAWGPDPRFWPSLDGGLVWWGGVLAGGGVGVGGAWALGVPPACALDALAPAAALALALGRVGCHLAGDGDWGMPTTLPWGVSYEGGVAGWPHPLGVRVHPAALYESAASLATYAWLRAAARSEPPPGRVAAWWALCAGATRTLVEVVRTNVPVVLGLSAAQLVGVALGGLGAWRLARPGDRPNPGDRACPGDRGRPPARLREPMGRGAVAQP